MPRYRLRDDAKSRTGREEHQRLCRPWSLPDKSPDLDVTVDDSPSLPNDVYGPDGARLLTLAPTSDLTE